MPDKYKFTKKERNASLRDLERIFSIGDEREFMAFLRKHGIKDEDSRFSEMVKIFRDLRAGKT
jgi:hypothetical protein